MRTILALLALLALTFALDEAVGKPIVHGLLCNPCKELVQKAENKGEEELETFLRKEITNVCGHLGAFKNICEHELDQLVEEMVPLIEQKLSPQEVCDKVRCC